MLLERVQGERREKKARAKSVTKTRTPPHNREAEQSVLGAPFLDGDALSKALEILSPDGLDFFLPAHRDIFRCMVTLYEQRIPVDIVTLSDKLKQSDHLKAVGGISYMADIVEVTPTAANISYYAKQVKALSVKRNLISKTTSLIEELYDEHLPLEEVIDRAQKEILGISMSTARPYEHVREVVGEVYEELKRLNEREGKHYLSGLPTGFMELDNLLGGFQKTDLIVFAARPSMGKSAVTIQIAGHMALQGYKVGIFPVEVGKKQLVKNILACQGRINTHRFRDGNFESMDKLDRAVMVVCSANIFIDDNARSSVEIVRQARKMKRECGLDVVFIDHLQAMREKGRFDNRNLEIDFMASNLKDMAKELNIPVILTSQLNREVERRDPPKPKLSDLRESGAIEQIADVVMSIYRPEYYKKNTEKKGVAEYEILKNRNGTLGDFDLRWNRYCLRFENMSDGPEGAVYEDESVPF